MRLRSFIPFATLGTAACTGIIPTGNRLGHGGEGLTRGQGIWGAHREGSIIKRFVDWDEKIFNEKNKVNDS